VKSHKVQLEARHSSKQSDFERNCEGQKSIVESAIEWKRSMLESAFEGKRSMLEQWFRVLSGFEARSSRDFEPSGGSKEKEACSSTDYERWFRADDPKSKLEQWFGAPSGQKASSSSDFERPVATEHVRAVISSAQSKKLHLYCVFECGRASLSFSVPIRAENLYSYMY